MVLGAVQIGDFCNELSGVLEILGWILTIFKIAIPLVIVGLGMFDFGKAVVDQKEDEIKKRTKRLLYRVLAGIVIFLLPSIVLWIFSAFVNDYDEATGRAEFDTCQECVLYPWNCN